MITAKGVVLEIVMLVVGYIALTVIAILGRTTMKLGRAVFSR